MGSVDRKTRDAKATELLARGMLDATRVAAAPPPPPSPVAQVSAPAPVSAAPAMAVDDETQGEDLPEVSAEGEEEAGKGGGWLKNLGLVLLGAFLAAVVGMVIQRRLLLGR